LAASGRRNRDEKFGKNLKNVDTLLGVSDSIHTPLPTEKLTSPMKKKSTSQSAFFNLRILTASVFCLLGIAVALFAQTRGSKQSNRSTTRQDAPGTQRPDIIQMVGPVMMTTNLRDLPYRSHPIETEEQPLTRYPRGKGAPPPEAPFCAAFAKAA
jgi:hypothetical protein